MAVIQPVQGTITQPFGCTGFSWEPPKTYHGSYCDHFHGGIDYGAPTGTPIYAALAGTVREAGWNISIAQGGGYSVWIQHNANFHTVYAHCNDLYVHPGQYVTTGSHIADVGSTGLSTGPHLHFAVWTVTTAWGFEVEDPALYIGGDAPNGGYGYTRGTEDIPSLEPIEGSWVKQALCTKTWNGYYAPPGAATEIVSVYVDGLKLSRANWLLVQSGSALLIDPTQAIPDSAQVRCDYYAA